jgi:hypothetical protein
VLEIDTLVAAPRVARAAVTGRAQSRSRCWRRLMPGPRVRERWCRGGGGQCLLKCWSWNEAGGRSFLDEFMSVEAVR